MMTCGLLQTQTRNQTVLCTKLEQAMDSTTLKMLDGNRGNEQSYFFECSIDMSGLKSYVLRLKNSKKTYFGSKLIVNLRRPPQTEVILYYLASTAII